MGYVPGRVMQDPSLPSLQLSERKVTELVFFFPGFPLALFHFSLSFGASVFVQMVYNEMCRVLAAIHSVDINAAELTDFGKRGLLLLRELCFVEVAE